MLTLYWLEMKNNDKSFNSRKPRKARPPKKKQNSKEMQPHLPWPIQLQPSKVKLLNKIKVMKYRNRVRLEEFMERDLNDLKNYNRQQDQSKDIPKDGGAA